MPRVDRTKLGLPPESEAEFQCGVVELARLLGWEVYHTRDSRGSDGGFPDLVLVRGGRVVFAELKAASGRTTPDQDRWIGKLMRTPAEVYLWRPGDWPLVEEILSSEVRP